jgi:SMI1/KNR4 family protein SUKH-1
VKAYTQAFQPNAPATSDALAALTAALDKPLPQDYMTFLERTNGGVGFIGKRYVILWSAEELIEVNRAYKVAEFFPNMFFIGTDGGGEAYAFDLSAKGATVFELPFIGLASDAWAIASSFDSFLAPLKLDRARPDRSAQATKLLTVVHDTFEFQDGTLHFTPLVPVSALEGLKAGDPLELKKPDGTKVRTTLYGLDMPSPMHGEVGLSVSKPLLKADVPIGTEIWKVD